MIGDGDVELVMISSSFARIDQVAKAFYLKIRPTVSFNLQDKVLLPHSSHWINTLLNTCGLTH